MKRHTYYEIGDRRFQTAAKARRWLWAQPSHAIASLRGHRIQSRDGFFPSIECVYRPAIVIKSQIYAHALNKIRGPKQPPELR